MVTYKFATLNGTGTTTTFNTGEQKSHTLQYTISSAGTVSVTPQGSLDGINFFNLENASVKSASTTTFTKFSDTPLNSIRVLASASGTTRTTSVIYTGMK